MAYAIPSDIIIFNIIMLTDNSMSVLFHTSSNIAFPINNCDEENTAFQYLKDNRSKQSEPIWWEGTERLKSNSLTSTFCKPLCASIHGHALHKHAHINKH